MVSLVAEGDGHILCYGIKSDVQSVKLIDISGFTLFVYHS